MLRKLLYFIATVLGIIVFVVVTDRIVNALSEPQHVDMTTILCIIGIAAYTIYDVVIVIRDTDVLNWLFKKFWKR